MIDREQNPEFINSFLDYSITILNKSPNSIKEYNYDLAMFFKYMKIHFHLTNESDFTQIDIKDFPLEKVKDIKLDDIHSFIAYLATNLKSKAATRARKISTIRIFFNYLTNKAHILEINPAQTLETPKQDKRIPKYLSLDDSKKLLNITASEENRNKERDYAIINRKDDYFKIRNKSKIIYAIITLFLNCGMRLSELVGINIKDIDFNECKLNVIGKGNKERTIYLNKACINAIDDYLNIRPKEKIQYNSKDALFY
jgi:integrase/recombinase XerD